MFAFVLSNVVGLVRQILISRAFGTGSELDAFNAASTFPDVIFTLIAGGALASAFIPAFTGFLTKGDHRGAWKLASSIINLVILILIAASILSEVFSLQIVKFILAPDFSLDQQILTASLLRIMLIAPTVFGVSGILMGVINAHQRFLLPALAPSMLWVGYIIGVLFFVPYIGIYGLAWGGVLGAFLHLLIQAPDLFRLHERSFSFTLGMNNPAVREVITLMGPRVVGVAVVQLNFIVNVIIATAQPVGSLSAIKLGFAVMTMPEVAIAQAIAIAALPTFSEQFARGRLDEMRSSLAATLRGVILLSLPATLGLILLRRPIVVLLFQRGEFDAHSTDLVAWALLWYTVGLVGHSLVEILSRAFYAVHDTKTPVIVGAVAMSLNVVFSFAFSAWFTSLGWMPHGGLALANSSATALEMTALFILMRRRLKGMDGMNILRGFAQSALGTLAMSFILLLWMRAQGSVWIIGVGGVALGGLVYALAIWAMKVPELFALYNGVARRFKRAN